MRVIKPSAIREFERRHANAATGLEHWLDVTESADWTRLQDVRMSLRSADEVRVASGRTVVVFNIGGNKYRLITAIH